MVNQFTLVSLSLRKYILINLKEKIDNIIKSKGVFMQYEIPYVLNTIFYRKFKKVVKRCLQFFN